MRILLAHKFHTLTGGAEFFYFEVARVLSEKGHKVAFFSTKGKDNIESEFSKYFATPPEYNKGSIFTRSLGIRKMVYSEESKKKFAALINDFKPDLIHVFAIHVHLTPSILEAASDAGVPVVMSCNDYKHICPNYKIYDGDSPCEACKGYKFYNAAIKKCCKNSFAFSIASTIEAYVHEHKKFYDRYVNRYLFASEFMLNKTKEFWADKNVNYGVLKNPFDALQYQPVYTGEYALYFGRITDYKGIDRIVDAAKLLTIPIKIIGDGPALNKLKSEVKKHKLTHIEFLGPKWGDDLNKILYGARYVIVPSVWHENFPYVIFQSFAAGKPVIGSIRGGIPELIGRDRGLLFDPDNIEELAEQMEKLWHDTDACENMGKLAREFVVREFTDERFYDSVMKNYQAVL